MRSARRIALVAALIVAGVFVSAAGLRAQAQVAVTAPTAAPATTPAASNAQSSTVPFKVFGADGKTLIFTGEYTTARDGSRITESQRFLTLAGKPAKLDQSVFDAGAQRPVSFLTVNYLTGDAFRIAVTGENVAWRSEDPAGALKSQSQENLPAGTFVWPNLTYVIARDWDQIAAGKTVAVDLFVVGRRMTVGLAMTSDGNVTVDGVPGIRVRAEPSSWVFRSLADPSWMTLSVEPPHRFLRFEGKGAIRDADGKDVQTVILFDWAHAS
jgi:hypothetical protein